MADNRKTRTAWCLEVAVRVVERTQTWNENALIWETDEDRGDFQHHAAFATREHADNAADNEWESLSNADWEDQTDTNDPCPPDGDL